MTGGGDVYLLSMKGVTNFYHRLLTSKVQNRQVFQRFESVARQGETSP